MKDNLEIHETYHDIYESESCWYCRTEEKLEKLERKVTANEE